MKLLVIGHTYIIGYYQKKFTAMKKIDPALQLRIVGPKRFDDRLHGNRPCEVHPDLDPEEVLPLGTVFNGSHMTLVLNPLRLARILREYRPDVIHIEEEPQACATIETVALRGAILPTAAITVFTWDNLLRPRKFPLGPLKRVLRSYSLRRVTSMVCGNREAERLLRERSHFQGSTVVLPQFGLDPTEHLPGNELEMKQRLGLTEGVVVGHMGRMRPEKGVTLLLRALATLAEYPWKLLLVGSGPLERQIRDEWMPRFPGRIVHVPAVPHQDVPRYLRCLDVFVLGSYAVPGWKEQFGLTLAQAMMVGVPCIASSSGAIPEVAGPTALIFREGDVESLREALVTLLMSARRRQEQGAQAREFALRHYTQEIVGARYLEVFSHAQRIHALAGREPTCPSAAVETSRTYHP